MSRSLQVFHTLPSSSMTIPGSFRAKPSGLVNIREKAKAGTSCRCFTWISATYLSGNASIGLGRGCDSQGQSVPSRRLKKPSRMPSVVLSLRPKLLVPPPSAKRFLRPPSDTNFCIFSSALITKSSKVSLPLPPAASKWTTEPHLLVLEVTRWKPSITIFIFFRPSLNVTDLSSWKVSSGIVEASCFLDSLAETFMLLPRRPWSRRHWPSVASHVSFVSTMVPRRTREPSGKVSKSLLAILIDAPLGAVMTPSSFPRISFAISAAR
mmetsp:Transcript_68825/g.149804  ORF Transcript_68825/g.149804 Transcript_68825/m.149804 type:complete len:266 (-) Transcript_68825:654-1451(-)